MSPPRVVAVAPASPAERAGIAPGDEVLRLNGEVPRDILRWRLLADEPEVEIDLRRGGLELTLLAEKRAGEPLGAEVESALFDQIRTCDNHCEFCFIYQLPSGLRSSLYLKDDDYRLSFLYGNFTTLTRFTEADLERVVDEGLSPLHVSIHATDPEVRSRMLRNRRGGTSLRWLRALLDHGITVHGQVVVCPGVNDGAVLDDTLAGVLDRYPSWPRCASCRSACPATTGSPGCGRTRSTRPPPSSTPSRTGRRCSGPRSAGGWPSPPTSTTSSPGGRSRPPTRTRASRCTRTASAWPAPSSSSSPAGRAGDRRPERVLRLGRRRAGRGLPRPRNPAAGTGLRVARRPRRRPARRARRSRCCRRGRRRSACSPDATAARCCAPSSTRSGATTSASIEVPNEFFGGNTGVTGLMVGADLSTVLAGEPEGHRYLLPDVCLSDGRFLDGTTPADLPRPVEVVADRRHRPAAALTGTGR